MKTKITEEGWHVIEGDLISGWVEETGMLSHDEFLIPLAVANIPVGGIVIDCGAYIGDHTVGYAKKVGTDPNGLVVAIEAGKTAFSCLLRNAEKFEGNVLCMNLALGDIHGGIAYHEVNETNVGASLVNDTPVESHEVRTATIDGIIASGDFPRLDFIKIDCEGFEYKILQGAKGALAQFRPMLLIEMNRGRLEDNGSSYVEIYDFLLEQNYAWRICEPQAKGGDEMYNILCWPNNIETLKREIITPD